MQRDHADDKEREIERQCKMTVRDDVERRRETIQNAREIVHNVKEIRCKMTERDDAEQRRETMQRRRKRRLSSFYFNSLLKKMLTISKYIQMVKLKNLV